MLAYKISNSDRYFMLNIKRLIDGLSILVNVGSNRVKRNGLNQPGDFIEPYVILEEAIIMDPG
jgi:hypothetical protein